MLVRAGVWLKLGDFVPGTLVFLLASASYSEAERFDAPQPELIAARISLIRLLASMMMGCKGVVLGFGAVSVRMVSG